MAEAGSGWGGVGRRGEIRAERHRHAAFGLERPRRSRAWGVGWVVVLNGLVAFVAGCGGAENAGSGREGAVADAGATASVEGLTARVDGLDGGTVVIEAGTGSFAGAPGASPLELHTVDVRLEASDGRVVARLRSSRGRLDWDGSARLEEIDVMIPGAEGRADSAAVEPSGRVSLSGVRVRLGRGVAREAAP